jgi:hypothetical protein
MIRRPLGSLLILGATAGVAYKLGKNQAEQIEEYTGVPPDQLSEEDLQAAMADLDIQPEPLDDEDRAAMASASESQQAAPAAPPAAPPQPQDAPPQPPAAPPQPQDAAAAPPPAPPQPPAPQGAPAAAEPDYIEELKQLAQLRDEGIISDEDFEAKKKQLLGL